ncbi:MAG TPA: CBS domain-containing protein [Acidimicrobiia bacterium]|nr:CBS domain-containing protein [Acidimicrobiia bacterium]
MRLSSLVGGHVETVDEKSNLRRAARLMSARQVGSLLVTDDGGILGIITEHDITRAVAEEVDIDHTAIGEWMTDYPQVATGDWTVEQALDEMLEHGFRHMPVVDDDTVAGMVSIKDLVWAQRGTSAGAR